MKKNLIAAAAALSFAGCLTLAHSIVLGTPTFTCSQGMRVYADGLMVDQQSTCGAVGRAWAACEAVCGKKATDNLTDFPIKWEQDPFLCGNPQVVVVRKVHGCVYNGDIYVARQDVIADEMGHVCLNNCGIVSEIELPDSGVIYTPEMLHFLELAK